jgi:hypothetical protein
VCNGHALPCCMPCHVLQSSTDLKPHVKEWLQHNSTNDQLSDFFVSKLATLSPCSGAFAVLRDVPCYVSAHFVDLTEAGEVSHRSTHWNPRKQAFEIVVGSWKVLLARAVLTLQAVSPAVQVLLSDWGPNETAVAAPSTGAGKGKGTAGNGDISVARGPLGKLRDMFSRSSSPSKPGPGAPGKGCTPISNSAIHELLGKYTGPLWGLVLKEACELCSVAARQGGEVLLSQVLLEATR